jgi:hypothetical protein
MSLHQTSGAAAINEYVLISRLPDARYVVLYGPRDERRGRFATPPFENLDMAIDWIDRLDRRQAGDGGHAAAGGSS